MPLVKQIFTSTGTFIVPAGITELILIGYGGGGGGGNGAFTTGSANLQGGPGGAGSIMSTQYITVVPNTSYTVTIGAGGAGGTGNAAAGNVGAAGADTTFGSLATFLGGGGGYDAENTFAMGGVPCRDIGFNRQHNGIFNGTAIPFSTYQPQAGAAGSGYTTDSFFFVNAGCSPQGFQGGAIGTTVTRFGGGGGGAGPGGNGGNASNGSLTTSSAGGSGGANTGAGGGGAGSANVTVGTGGAGGSGKLTVIWVDG